MPNPSSHSRVYLLLASLLAVDVCVFMFQKTASARADVQGWVFLREMLATPAMWAAVALAPVQLLLWTRILRSSDIGWAYPLTSLAYPLTMITASVILHERYDWHVWVGGLLITAGAGVLGPPQSTTPEPAT